MKHRAAGAEASTGVYRAADATCTRGPAEQEDLQIRLVAIVTMLPCARVLAIVAMTTSPAEWRLGTGEASARGNSGARLQERAGCVRTVFTGTLMG